MEKENRTHDFIEMLLNEGWNEISSENPAVLSCGGIYIPPRGENGLRFSYDILNTANEKEPVKVVVTKPLKNQLSILLAKEGLN